MNPSDPDPLHNITAATVTGRARPDRRSETGQPDEDQLLPEPVIAAVALQEEVVAETSLTIRLAAQQQHRPAAHHGGQFQVLEGPLSARSPGGNRLIAHPMLAILAVVDLRHQFQLHPAIGLGGRCAGRRCPGPARRSARGFPPPRTPGPASSRSRPRRRFHSADRGVCTMLRRNPPRGEVRDFYLLDLAARAGCPSGPAVAKRGRNLDRRECRPGSRFSPGCGGPRWGIAAHRPPPRPGWKSGSPGGRRIEKMSMTALPGAICAGCKIVAMELLVSAQSQAQPGCSAQ